MADKMHDYMLSVKHSFFTQSCHAAKSSTHGFGSLSIGKGPKYKPFCDLRSVLEASRLKSTEYFIRRKNPGSAFCVHITPLVYKIKIAPKVCVRVSKMAPNPLSYQGGSSSIPHNLSENQRTRFQYMIIAILNKYQKGMKGPPINPCMFFPDFSTRKP